MKYYAVKEGKIKGIFENWNDCKQSISGFSNPDFKGFDTKEEAVAYLEDKDLWADIVLNDINEGYVVAFCDGSYDEKLNRYSYGVVAINLDNKKENLCGSGSNPKYKSSCNIIGEIFGAINAMDWAISNGYEKIKIYHDYEGVSKWITGEWAAKSETAKMYTCLYNAKFNGVLEIEFVKVKGHSNNKYNEEADCLAKSALYDGQKIAIQGNNYFVVSHINEEDFDVILDLMCEEYTQIKKDKNTNSLKSTYHIRMDNHTVVVTIFHSQMRKLLVQAKESLLLQILITYMTELESITTIDRIMSGAYRKTIEETKTNNIYSELFQNLPNDYPTSSQKLLKQAIINLNYYVESEDYSQYVFPALRALEGHIKYLITTATNQPVPRFFNCFNKDNNSNNYIYVGTGDTSIKLQIERCYNYYKTQRDSLFHFGDIIGATDNTRIINNKDDADEIIKECFNLINQYS